MTRLRSLTACLLALGLAACATSEPATRGASVDPQMIASGTQAVVTPDYRVTAINVSVPANLRVSEANTFFPVADIVWHGDPIGDRHAQVKSIFQEAFASGTADLTGRRAVILEATVTRFHALTPKARYTTGGMFTMHFVLTLRDAATGAIIDGPRPIVADARGAGGERAIQEEAQGLTQRIVIEQRLAQVIREELTAPVAMPAAPGTVEAVSRQDFSPTDLNIVE